MELSNLSDFDTKDTVRVVREKSAYRDSYRNKYPIDKDYWNF